MFSRGHVFPENDFDYELITYYIEQEIWKQALSDYKYELKHKGILEEISDEKDI